MADSYFLAGTGRFMIGLGCAFAYIGTLKLASIWVPANRFGMIAGLTTAIGMTSGKLTQTYLTKVVETVGYKQALHTAVIIGILLSIVIVLLVRSRPKTIASNVAVLENPVNVKQLLSSIRLIFMNKQMWLIGIIGCLVYLPSSVFLDLWGIPYLKAVYQLTPAEAVATCGYTFYGWIIAGPLIGWISDKVKLRVLPMALTGLGAAILLCMVFYVPGLSITTLNISFFMIGFCCGAHSLVFALGKESNSIHVSGTAVAVTNMLIMAGGAIFQPVVGKLLDLHTTSPVGLDGLPVYSASDYTFALSVVPIGVALGIFLCLFLKETYCESQATEEHESLFKTGGLQPQTEAAN